MPGDADSSLADFDGRLVLVGAGKMGMAMLAGWLRLGLNPARVIVLEPQPSSDLQALAARGVSVNLPSPSAATVMIIAVKPQIAAEALAPLHAYAGSATLAVSIMAGKTIGFLRGVLPRGTAVVRAMPNTPASVGRAMTVAVASADVSSAQRGLANRLLASIGQVAWVDDESLMDAVTAVSGSGPAYVFLLAESLARAGAAAGLPADLAATLARWTIAGAGELMHRSALDAATLRQNVTSPGGTTAAALAVLMAADGLDPLLREAVLAAARRSRELAG